jgi:hypothetical protein
MHRRSVSEMGTLTLAILLTIATSSCATMPAGPVVALPNGYYLRPDQSKQTVLVKRGGTRILPGNVAAYAVSGVLVAGAEGKTTAASREYTNDLPFSGGPDTRYFILHTQSGQLESDLNKAAWQARLKELGVPSDFEIFPPLPWTQ